MPENYPTRSDGLIATLFEALSSPARNELALSLDAKTKVSIQVHEFPCRVHPTFKESKIADMQLMAWINPRIEVFSMFIEILDEASHSPKMKEQLRDTLEKESLKVVRAHASHWLKVFETTLGSAPFSDKVFLFRGLLREPSLSKLFDAIFDSCSIKSENIVNSGCPNFSQAEIFEDQNVGDDETFVPDLNRTRIYRIASDSRRWFRGHSCSIGGETVSDASTGNWQEGSFDKEIALKREEMEPKFVEAAAQQTVLAAGFFLNTLLSFRDEVNENSGLVKKTSNLEALVLNALKRNGRKTDIFGNNIPLERLITDARRISNGEEKSFSIVLGFVKKCSEVFGRVIKFFDSHEMESFPCSVVSNTFLQEIVKNHLEENDRVGISQSLVVKNLNNHNNADVNVEIFAIKQMKEHFDAILFLVNSRNLIKKAGTYNWVAPSGDKFVRRYVFDANRNIVDAKTGAKVKIN